MKTHTYTTTLYTIPGAEIEVELPCEPSPTMQYKEPLVRITDDKIILGYLAHDDDCENPLENDDYMGYIYEGRRNGSTLRGYDKALGFADGAPDLRLVPEEDVVREAVSRVLEDPKLKAEALEQCRAKHEQGEQDDDDFLLWHLDSIDELEPILNVEGINEELWREGRKNGTIGNKYVVLLDVYEHSGISYSVSGQGMQCQFDTARGGAVWVPNICCELEIERRAVVYRKGDIHEMRDGRFKVQTLNETLLQYSSDEHPFFEHWYQAFEYLAKFEPPHQRDLAAAEQIAARELAAQAAEQYTDWCNGNCYGVVVVTYDKQGVEIDHDSCWGFIGDDHAYESLKNDYFPKEKAMTTEITGEHDDDDNWFEAARAEHPALYAELESLIERYGIVNMQDALSNIEDKP